MGPFSYLSFMECYHGILSMKHSLEGTLSWNGQLIDFTNGIGYLEKDWGSSFPCNPIYGSNAISLAIRMLAFSFPQQRSRF